MVKKPEEVKQGLEHCSGINACAECVYDKRDFPHCVVRMCKDASAYIQQLESQVKEMKHTLDVVSNHSSAINEASVYAVEQMARQRDALLEYLMDSRFVHCSICKHNTGEGAMGCKRIREVKGPCFEWRGVPEKEEAT